ncbi:hypothetical protein [Lyngbya sp. PCC 8106]|uniref:hypothetical protein n=1 Tax=Lyngbya sp. (strain PCC 8106) TaxID=313612 RepID=UPI0000EAB602|nr:hypothetical protein [Lyngbya sp. PCC 8106]EAW35976.1 hypothetical protein L8106_22311 [Lyngbya sp. PCC 8106]
MTEQEIIHKLITHDSEFLKDTYFGIVEETLSIENPLHQAIAALNINAQMRIMYAINWSF